jgi:predicted PurR-regulated permease PerM
MAFFLNFIPNLGSIFVVICIRAQVIVQFYPSVFMFVLVASSMTALQFTLGSIIEPKIQGDRLNLSASVIIFSLVFWGWLWGPVGALLAVPITVTIKIICLSFSSLKQIGILMGAGVIKYRKSLLPKKPLSDNTLKFNEDNIKIE